MTSLRSLRTSFRTGILTEMECRANFYVQTAQALLFRSGRVKRNSGILAQ